MTSNESLEPMERLQNFLKSFLSEEGVPIYRQRISQMATSGSKFLLIDFEDLLTFDEPLARDLIEKPEEYLKHADDAAWNQLKIEDPEYAEKIKKVRTRFRNLPEAAPLRVLGSEHIEKLIIVNGILVRATPVQPMLITAAFKCRCGNINYVEQTGVLLKTPPVCDNPACRRAGPFDFVEDESTFINSQEIRIQERPEDLPPGQLPRWIDIRLFEDIVDTARPGDRVSVVGIVRPVQQFLSRRGRLRTFNLSLDANFIEVAGKEHEIVQISPEEEGKILELAKDPMIHQKIIRSIAPSIYGYEDLKESIMFLLFGGVPKTLPDGINIRGDANVLFLGDPGTAKSQLLQYVAKIAPRGLYTSGRGSTAAGLTAAVLREKGGGMVLEAGALVLSDKGICCIDEIDKMRPEDRVAIHEAMEQRTVSIAKGGIVAMLNARSSILAAANPALGRYDPYRTIGENLSLPITILSRFDLIFVIRDQPDRDIDLRMAEHILSLHRTGTPSVEPPIPPDLLRKYISYAKEIKPVLTQEAVERLKDFYLGMRSTSESSDSPIAITARQLESLTRLSEARARSALRKEVTVEDAEAVILLMRKSMQQVGIDVASGKYDIDIIMTGKPKSVRDKLGSILSTIVEMEKATGMVREEDLYDRLQKDFKIDRIEASKLVNQLTKEGTIYSPTQGHLKKA